MNHDKTISAILDWLTQVKPETNGLLIPVSGGSDSALCFWLCNQVLKHETKGIYIGSDLRCMDWFDAQGTVQLDEVSIGGKNPEVQRWAHFLTVSLQENRVLTGSRNLTETALGTFSNASRVAAILPLAGLWKSQVMELCEYVGVPSEVTASSRRADPECGRPAKMADIPFDIVDKYLAAKQGIEVSDNLNDVTPEQYDYLEKVYTQNSYKVNLPLAGPVAINIS